MKTEIIVPLDLWRRGLLGELALRGKVQARARPLAQRSKTAKAAMRVARIIHKQPITRAANLAGSLGVTDIKQITDECSFIVGAICSAVLLLH